MLLLKSGIFNDVDHGIIHIIFIWIKAQSCQQEILIKSPLKDVKIVELKF